MDRGSTLAGSPESYTVAADFAARSTSVPDPGTRSPSTRSDGIEASAPHAGLSVALDSHTEPGHAPGFLLAAVIGAAIDTGGERDDVCRSDDLAGNYRILIECIDRAHTMIAVGDN